MRGKCGHVYNTYSQYQAVYGYRFSRPIHHGIRFRACTVGFYRNPRHFINGKMADIEIDAPQFENYFVPGIYFREYNRATNIAVFRSSIIQNASIYKTNLNLE